MGNIRWCKKAIKRSFCADNFFMLCSSNRIAWKFFIFPSLDFLIITFPFKNYENFSLFIDDFHASLLILFINYKHFNLSTSQFITLHFVKTFESWFIAFWSFVIFIEKRNNFLLIIKKRQDILSSPQLWRLVRHAHRHYCLM